jgi:CubicO group peptidase (beta-lactamase class C family)
VIKRPSYVPDSRRIDLVLERVRLEVDSGVLPSAQVAISVDGRQYAFEAFGEATTATRYVLQSAGRPVVAGVLWKLMSDGLLDIGRTVGSYIPEFATNGKESVTVEQVVTHVGGFPLAPLAYPQMLHRDQRLEAFGKWRLTSPPGTALEFHLTSAAWVIGELCERVTGRPIAQYLVDELAGPLGLHSIEIGPSVLCRPRRCSLPDRFRRSGNWIVLRVPHQRLPRHRLRAVTRGPQPHHQHRQHGRRLLQLIGAGMC